MSNQFLNNYGGSTAFIIMLLQITKLVHSSPITSHTSQDKHGHHHHHHHHQQKYEENVRWSKHILNETAGKCMDINEIIINNNSEEKVHAKCPKNGNKCLKSINTASRQMSNFIENYERIIEGSVKKDPMYYDFIVTKKQCKSEGIWDRRGYNQQLEYESPLEQIMCKDLDKKEVELELDQNTCSQKDNSHFCLSKLIFGLEFYILRFHSLLEYKSKNIARHHIGRNKNFEEIIEKLRLVLCEVKKTKMECYHDQSGSSSEEFQTNLTKARVQLGDSNEKDTLMLTIEAMSGRGLEMYTRSWYKILRNKKHRHNKGKNKNKNLACRKTKKRKSKNKKSSV